MSDPSKIIGPSGKPIEPTAELKAIVNPEEFQKLMQQVQKTDPDQEKKRKQQEEETEEAPPNPILSAEPEDPNPVKGPSFLEVQKSSSSSQPTLTTSSVSSGEEGYQPSIASPFLSNVPDEQEWSFSPPPSSNVSSTSNTSPTPTVSFSETPATPPTTPSSETTNSDKQKEKEQKKAPLLSPDGTQTLPSLSHLILPPPVDATPIELPPESLPLLMRPITAPLEEIVELLPTEKADQKRKNLLEEGEMSLLDPSLASLHSPFISPPTEVTASNPFATMPTAIQELFTRMLGVITVMNLTPGITETTFILNSPQFASSVFFGSQIIIREFSTAPQVFNIQLSGSTQATNLFNANLTTLAAAFEAGAPNFRINRLETGYVQEKDRPLFHRKEGENEEDSHDSRE